MTDNVRKIVLDAYARYRDDLISVARTYNGAASRVRYPFHDGAGVMIFAVYDVRERRFVSIDVPIAKGNVLARFPAMDTVTAGWSNEIEFEELPLERKEGDVHEDQEGV